RTRFLEFVRGLGVPQPRLKFLPLLRIGRERRRTHSYAEALPLGNEPLAPEVEATLLCATSRTVSSQGVFTCPILVKHASARMGDGVRASMRGLHLNWSACQTCVLEGLRCNT